ncbi:MAG: type 2 isopentenyl-diphosphate Delta-isomerase [Thermoanaerobaculia bacterium]
MSLPSTADHEKRDRKAEHIDLALEERMQLSAHFFDRYYFDHQALPEIDMADVDTTARFLGYRLRSPLLISCMTGGTGAATRINRNLAIAAQTAGIAIGVGSQRKAIEDPSQVESFRIRSLAPDVPILANLGAVQLNYGFGLAECRQAVEMIEADALVLHLNPLQEAIQPEGQCNFAGLVEKMARVAADLEVPVLAKEIGCGLSFEAGRRLKDAGITILDTAGLGGTSWARIEASRADDVGLGELFSTWGVATPRSIRELRALGGITIIASGGLRSGLDVAKAIAMGADLAGMAQRFLEAAHESPEAAVERAATVRRELRIAMFCAGAGSVTELQSVELRRIEQLAASGAGESV